MQVDLYWNVYLHLDSMDLRADQMHSGTETPAQAVYHQIHYKSIAYMKKR